MPGWLLVIFGALIGLAGLAAIVALGLRAGSQPKRRKSWLAKPSGDLPDTGTYVPGPGPDG